MSLKVISQYTRKAVTGIQQQGRDNPFNLCILKSSSNICVKFLDNTNTFILKGRSGVAWN